MVAVPSPLSIETAVNEVLDRHEPVQASLLPILHDIQAVLGHVPEAAMRLIAQALNLSRAEVYGVVSFYHDFRQAPEPRPVLKLCRAEACQARGVEAVLAAVPATDRVKIETVYCLGLCSVGPNAMVGDRVHARLDAARLTTLLDSLV